MRISYLLIALLIVAGIAISGCTSPSPVATVSPTIAPTVAPTATVPATPTASAMPTSAATATPTAAPSPTSSVTSAGNLAISGVSIDWYTGDMLQHDTAHVTVKNLGSKAIGDLSIVYTVVTPIVMANPDGSPGSAKQSLTNSLFVGILDVNQSKTLTIQSPDHAKNVPADITIKATWKGGEATILHTVLQAPDNKIGTQTY